MNGVPARASGTALPARPGVHRTVRCRHLSPSRGRDRRDRSGTRSAHPSSARPHRLARRHRGGPRPRASSAAADGASGPRGRRALLAPREPREEREPDSRRRQPPLLPLHPSPVPAVRAGRLHRGHALHASARGGGTHDGGARNGRLRTPRPHGAVPRRGPGAVRSAAGGVPAAPPGVVRVRPPAAPAAGSGERRGRVPPRGDEGLHPSAQTSRQRAPRDDRRGDHSRPRDRSGPPSGDLVLRGVRGARARRGGGRDDRSVQSPRASSARRASITRAVGGRTPRHDRKDAAPCSTSIPAPSTATDAPAARHHRRKDVGSGAYTMS